ncbi:L-2-amino-thiazoline-4-carboxylic acid hydrolase [Bradyrhizobium sp. 21]|uniref:L-2-amino-thiazoline-4-carboxylic acid hydrolase n=1 Tax=Bradyrhizobium sp. 21 TaxID=2782666 RepID=UPI003211C8EC|nr:L-2-amino-thiazoline-4-carboxylic acid hydrolase [Bradyrhizobium sp. 21]
MCSISLGQRVAATGNQQGRTTSVSELGFLLTCTADFATAEGFGRDVKLTRAQTIMQGADHCNFRYRHEARGSQ